MEDEEEKPKMQFKSREVASNYFRTVYAQMVTKTIEDKASKLIRKEQAHQAEIDRINKDRRIKNEPELPPVQDLMNVQH